MKIWSLIYLAVLGFVNLFGSAFGATTASVIKCPDFYKDLYFESDILAKFQKILENGDQI
jgi:hypothetical protein